ncbi:small ribosomal subunit protein uS2m [Neocloeon triangulifer]|uniref:small ribosomal subunit protein uS2m n=1 Tax=Neocloeon triangulifer TaxID=2078957 RepID=UPI00286F205A|nr:small ribosomal subunit protein uS2m [Neocloeon triangulifer]
MQKTCKNMFALRTQIRKCSAQAALANRGPAPSTQESPQTALFDMEPLKQADYFGVQKLVKINDLFEAKVHLGHMEGSLHPAMRPYMYGSRLGHCVFDLDTTASLLRRSLHVLANVVYRDGVVLFLSPPSQGPTARATELCAQRCKEFSHVRKWREGTFTNSEKKFGLVTRLPDLCIFIGTPHDAIVECAKMNIPSIGIVDSNTDPTYITYHIPGNDDSASSINYFCKLFSNTINLVKAKKNDKKSN